jgi:vacuolar protein sorting-associated protein 45
MIGGTTYEEARVVSLLNQELPSGGNNANPVTRILLGGTSVHNSSSYIAMIQAALPNFPSNFTQPPVDVPAPTTPGGPSTPSLNVQLGSLNLSVGGVGGTGIYRTGEGVGIQTDGIKDGVKNLFGKVRQGVESIGLP